MVVSIDADSQWLGADHVDGICWPPEGIPAGGCRAQDLSLHAEVAEFRGDPPAVATRGANFDNGFASQRRRGKFPYLHRLGQHMIHDPVNAPIAVWDWDEPPLIYRHNIFLLDRAALYFKRELLTDHGRDFYADAASWGADDAVSNDRRRLENFKLGECDALCATRPHVSGPWKNTRSQQGPLGSVSTAFRSL
jgi:hypothetical protein